MALIFGTSGNDSLQGSTGADTLVGGLGNDTLTGGGGIDLLDGGGGNDTYVISGPDFDIVDSGGSDTAIVSVSFVKLPSTIENVTYAAGAQALPYWIDALLNDNATGNAYQRLMASGNTINYAYPTSLPAYDTDSENAFMFSGFNAAQKTFSKQALAYISTVLNLDFVEVSDPAAVNTISFGNNVQASSAAYAYLPSPSFLGGDVFLDSGTPGNLAPQDGRYEALTLIHELGHSLGLEHPFSGGTDTPHLPAAENSTEWTVMSYDESPLEYHLAYSVLDIAALQYLYGPSSTARTGNDSYVVSSASTNFVWDGAGVDTLDASAQTQALTLYLDAGYWGFVGTKASKITAAGQVTVNFGSVIENLSGGSGHDALYGNAVGNLIKGGAGNDTINGNAGSDTLNGGLGNDSLVGGTGRDTASYANAAGAVAASLSGAGTATGADGTDALLSIENLIGSAFADSLTGSTAANRLEGGAGNDSLNGAIGADVMLGGSGDDQYSVDNIGDVISEKLAQGMDTVLSSVSFVLAANIENLRLTASTAINGTGNSLGNLIWAGAGDNILNGSSGTDTVSYAYSKAGVTASLSSKSASGGSGNDSVVGFENLAGSNYADSLTGSSIANLLTGGAGNDSLKGSTGNDTLLGGSGNDLINGGTGQDLLTGDAGADTFDFDSLAEMGLTSASWDSISDFNGTAGDRIDLSTLDANTALSGNQQFSFIGAASFTGAGQLRYDTSAGVLYGSVDADLDAELAIQLTGAPFFGAEYLVA
ncbi:MAG: M10 family metallopeptidase C-terminal domain-containing protein [Pseudomonadota bacterium]